MLDKAFKSVLTQPNYGRLRELIKVTALNPSDFILAIAKSKSRFESDTILMKLAIHEASEAGERGDQGVGAVWIKGEKNHVLVFHRGNTNQSTLDTEDHAEAQIFNTSNHYRLYYRMKELGVNPLKELISSYLDSHILKKPIGESLEKKSARKKTSLGDEYYNHYLATSKKLLERVVSSPTELLKTVFLFQKFAKNIYTPLLLPREQFVQLSLDYPAKYLPSRVELSSSKKTPVSKRLFVTYEPCMGCLQSTLKAKTEEIIVGTSDKTGGAVLDGRTEGLPEEFRKKSNAMQAGLFRDIWRDNNRCDVGYLDPISEICYLLFPVYKEKNSRPSNKDQLSLFD